MGTTRCGFCGTRQHSMCPGALRNGDGKIWRCSCGCPTSQVVRCFRCKRTSEHTQLHEQSLECVDIAECDEVVEVRLLSNPVVRQLRGIRAESRVERIERRTERTTRVGRTGTCAHCGEPTKGGAFLPGHDSRYISALFEQVRGGAPASQALAKLGAFPRLADKLSKRLAAAGLAADADPAEVA